MFALPCSKHDRLPTMGSRPQARVGWGHWRSRQLVKASKVRTRPPFPKANASSQRALSCNRWGNHSSALTLLPRTSDCSEVTRAVTEPRGTRPPFDKHRKPIATASSEDTQKRILPASESTATQASVVNFAYRIAELVAEDCQSLAIFKTSVNVMNDRLASFRFIVNEGINNAAANLSASRSRWSSQIKSEAEL
jgi:hypothetical protein